MMASAICRLAGKDVPIYPGAALPLLLPQRQVHAAQATAIDHWDHQRIFPKGEAVEFLRSTIRKYPGEVMLLTIAPLTNIGLLFSVDPEIPKLLKGLVMMCGRFFDPPPPGYAGVEWNAVVDAHASSIVYRGRVGIHRSIGLDVTSHVTMSQKEFRASFEGLPLFGPVLEWSDIWFRDWPGTTYHDPLAAATIFEPSLCTFQQGTAEILLAEGETFGTTKWTPLTDVAPHEAAMSVNSRGFFSHYFSVVRGKK
jgi:inosine-uridine nucleoside N-ribohydrolase